MFGAHLTVLRQPLRAAGRSNTAADRLVALVDGLPPGSALALVEERPSRDITKPPALLKRLADAVKTGVAAPWRNTALRGAASCAAGSPRMRHAWASRVEVRAAHILAERIGGAIWETDVERGEMTRIA